MKKITVLGVTGSIGTQTIDVVTGHPDEFEIVAMSAGHNIKKLEEIMNNPNPQQPVDQSVAQMPMMTSANTNTYNTPQQIQTPTLSQLSQDNNANIPPQNNVNNNRNLM